jgi:hypothetical protein
MVVGAVRCRAGFDPKQSLICELLINSYTHLARKQPKTAPLLRALLYQRASRWWGD